MAKLTALEMSELAIVFMRSDAMVRQRYSDGVIDYATALTTLTNQEHVRSKLFGGPPSPVTHLEPK